MAYFSNGTEGALYEDRYCYRCIHGPEHDEGQGCAVWVLHLIHNGESDKRELLDALIPMEGVRPGQCRMFVECSPISTEGDTLKLKAEAR